MTPRGIINNNPLNIRSTATPWAGKVAESSDRDFEQFTSMAYGLRAAMVNLRTIVRRMQGDITVAKVIAVWAPPHENDTDAYARVVASALFVEPDTPLDSVVFNLFPTMMLIVRAMVNVECGAGWADKIQAADYREAARMVALALVP